MNYHGNYGATRWWLRSPGDSPFTIALINRDGTLNLSGDSVYAEHHSGIGVRPALWINFDLWVNLN